MPRPEHGNLSRFNHQHIHQQIDTSSGICVMESKSLSGGYLPRQAYVMHTCTQNRKQSRIKCLATGSLQLKVLPQPE
jgi:hypothetical protein